MAHKLVYRLPHVYEKRLSEICELLPKLKDIDDANSILLMCSMQLEALKICEDHDVELSYE